MAENRTTKKEDGFYYPNPENSSIYEGLNVYDNVTPMFRCLQRLGPLEDREESLGIPIDELLDLRIGTFIYMGDCTGIVNEVYLMERLVSIKTSKMDNGLNVCRLLPLNEFGKTWSTKREDLQ